MRRELILKFMLFTGAISCLFVAAPISASASPRCITAHGTTGLICTAHHKEAMKQAGQANTQDPVRLEDALKAKRSARKARVEAEQLAHVSDRKAKEASKAQSILDDAKGEENTASTMVDERTRAHQKAKKYLEDALDAYGKDPGAEERIKELRKKVESAQMAFDEAKNELSAATKIVNDLTTKTSAATTEAIAAKDAETAAKKELTAAKNKEEAARKAYRTAGINDELAITGACSKPHSSIRKTCLTIAGKNVISHQNVLMRGHVHFCRKSSVTVRVHDMSAFGQCTDKKQCKLSLRVGSNTRKFHFPEQASDDPDKLFANVATRGTQGRVNFKILTEGCSRKKPCQFDKLELGLEFTPATPAACPTGRFRRVYITSVNGRY